MKAQKPFSRRRIGVIISIALPAITIIMALRIADHRRDSPVSKPVTSLARPKPAAPAATASVPAGKTLLRPLPVSHKSSVHEWTEGDGSDPAVIEKLAHGPDEFIRMAEENERIKRRQLVYRQDPVASIVQRARAVGESVRRLTLPGFDGQEIDVEVTGSDLALSGLSGTFTGRLRGKAQSIVTVAFKNNREAFSVSSPEDGLYLEAEPREPNEIIVKAIDPNTYATGRCGTPDYQANQGN